MTREAKGILEEAGLTVEAVEGVADLFNVSDGVGTGEFTGKQLKLLATEPWCGSRT